MAGYFRYSKSNNAVNAETMGSYPLTTAAKVIAKEYGVTQTHARQWLENNGSREWHHVSKYYNETYYYNTDLKDEEVADLHAFTPARKSKAVPVVKTGTLLYNVWTGTRKHPICREYRYHGEYTIKGDWFIFDGMRKKCTTCMEV